MSERAMFESSTIAPAWLVLPMAGVSLLAVLVHLSMLHSAEVAGSMPLSRHRLRTAGGVVTLMTIPVLAYSFGVVTPADPRAFTMAWSASMGLLGMLVVIAGLDALNSMRVHRRELRRLRAKRRDAMAELDMMVLAHRRSDAGSASDVSSQHDR